MFTSSIRDDKYYSNLNKVMFVLLVLLALAGGVSDAFSRNLVRCIIPVALILAWMSAKYRENLYKYRKLAGLFLIFACIVAIQILRTGNTFEILATNRVWFSYNILLLFIVAAIDLSLKQVRTILFAAGMMLLANDFYIYYEFATSNLRPQGIIHIIAGTTTIYMTVLPILITAFFFIKNNVYKICMGINVMLGCVALLLIQTRGAWLSIFFVSVFLMFICRHMINWKKAITVVAVVLAVFGGIMSSSNVVANRVHSTIQTVTGEREDGRIIIWKIAVRMIEDNYMTGVGMHNFLHEFNKYYTPDLGPARRDPAEQAHNVFLQLWAETGIAGVSAFCLAFGYMVCRLWKKRTNPYALMGLSATLGVILYGMTEYPLMQFEAMRVYWLCMGVCLAGINARERYTC